MFLISSLYLPVYCVSPALVTAMSHAWHIMTSVNICQIMKPEFWSKLLALILISCLTQANHILSKISKVIWKNDKNKNNGCKLSGFCTGQMKWCTHDAYQSHHYWNCMLLFLFQNPKWMRVLVPLFYLKIRIHTMSKKSKCSKALFLCYSLVNY